MEDAQAGEQGVVEMEGGVFGGGADEDEGAVFDVGQEGVLLGFVEAVDFVDKEDGFAAQAAFLLGFKDGFAHFFDAGEDGGEADEARVEGVGEEQGKGGFAAAGRAPEQHGEGFLLGDGDGERHAGAEDVFLSDVVGKGFGAQAFGKGNVAAAAEEGGLAGHGGWWDIGVIVRKFAGRFGKRAGRLFTVSSALGTRGVFASVLSQDAPSGVNAGFAGIAGSRQAA